MIGGLAGGYIAGNIGISWLNWINAILSGVLFITCCLFQPETLFSRVDHQLDAQAELSVDPVKIQPLQQIENIEPFEPCENGFSFRKSLKIGLYRPGFMKRLIGPFLTLRLPGVWLVMFWYAGLIAGVVTIATVGPVIMAMPPYMWGANTGCINVGGVVGIFLGFFVTAAFSDRLIACQTAKNPNAYIEAEVRLPLAIPGLLLATTGLWTFGFCANSQSPHLWIGMEFGLGMLCFGMMMVSSIGFNYVCYVFPLPLLHHAFLLN